MIDPMRRAFIVARRSKASDTSPNPRVGCVMVKGGRIIAEGAHRRFGGAHAEPMALHRARERARGATAYLTMEPCSPFKGKKTPSCAETLAARGIKKVVCASLDPNPKVAGRGVAILRRAGITVELAENWTAEAEKLNRGFFSLMRRGRPWVILKTALSLDGKAASASGKSRWVTGPNARAEVHRLRAQVDAILVGAGTVLADDPALTAHGAGKNPLRVVLAGRRALPKKARVFDSAAPTVVYKPKGSAGLRAVLKELSKRGVGTLLVEGGPTVHAAFLRAGLIDEAKVFLSPKLLSGADDPNTAPRLKSPKIGVYGDDWLIDGVVS
ncbi:MAG: bifunctional diaminohydroxyphosphoribosylaminopyrimidine deaminase/5-amino-6-(5-phosphoribosylamino)uracil reductase RibD [Elusimicrobiota bacterium]|nr:MAG: bifunctional diaminohydroxyphosphoribosylaminopyrimidine deaminase/5-amino-6-(5-phosphoribosylamino)uracil reductase RibD [Elusimicrobiota bacterium]